MNSRRVRKSKLKKLEEKADEIITELKEIHVSLPNDRKSPFRDYLIYSTSDTRHFETAYFRIGESSLELRVENLFTLINGLNDLDLEKPEIYRYFKENKELMQKTGFPCKENIQLFNGCPYKTKSQKMPKSKCISCAKYEYYPPSHFWGSHLSSVVWVMMSKAEIIRNYNSEVNIKF